ncbi:MAG: LamG-like jellyroll fold domain-containing protein [Bacteroidota bacterium]
MTKKLLLLLSVIAFNASFSQGNYLDFDGVNDNVNVANSGNAVASATAITMSCKVYPKSTTTGFPNFDGFVGYRNETNLDFYLVQLSATQVEARFRNASNVAFSITYSGLTLNQWNHFFLVYDGTTLKLYKGATMVGSTPASGAAPASNTSTFKIGLIQFQTYNWYHSGFIDEVSLWNKGLSSTEIGTIVANNGEIANPMTETNLKLYYKFNQGIPYGVNTGLTTLTDEKAAYNGTLTNFALTGNSSNWGSQTLNNSDFGVTKGAIFPNPTSSILNFTGFSDVSNIKIIDMSGRIVLNEMITSQDVAMNVSELQSGMYFAMINDTEKIKFIKK